MATVNIPSNLEDPNYRYKMPRVRAKIEGRGNGIKTNIMNMSDIARALKRPPEYPTKFCGCELGSQSKFELSEGKAIVNGAHTDADIQLIIDKFVDKYVLCPNCRLPEVDILVSKGRVRGKCNACGFQGDMDNAHKVSTYIVKNPPVNVESTVGKKGGRKTKEDKKSSKISTSKEVSESKPAKEASESKPAKEASESKPAKEASESKPAKEASEPKLPKSAKSSKRKSSEEHDDRGISNDSPDPNEDDRLLTFDSPEIAVVISRLSSFWEEKNPTPLDYLEEVRLLQVAQDFCPTLRVYVAIAGALKLYSNATAETIKSIIPYVQVICDRSVSACDICEALEELCTRVFPELWSHFAKICSLLYNADVLDEGKQAFEAYDFHSESLLNRYNSTAKSPARPANPGFLQAQQLCQPFVKWLLEAESESEEDDEEEESEASLMGSGDQTHSASADENQEQVTTQIVNGRVVRFKQIGRVALDCSAKPEESQGLSSPVSDDPDDIDINDL